MKKSLLYLLFALTITAFSQSQNIRINWQQPIKEKNAFFLSFESATYNQDFLPIYHFRQKTLKNYASFEMKILETAILSSEEYEIVKHFELENEFLLSTSTYGDGKDFYQSIDILPIRKNPSTNQLEKLIQFELINNESTNLLSTRSIRTSSSSEMSQGEWMKIGVLKTGIFSITYDQMANSGIQSIQLPRLFGNGGAALPESNAISMPDDMQELKYQANLGSDQIFNSGDYILFYAEGPLTWSYNNTYSKFEHKNHEYSDTIFYFLSFGNGTGINIPMVNPTVSNPQDIRVYTDHMAYENNLVNLLKSGKEWYGEEFNNIRSNRDFTFNVPDIILDSIAKIYTYVGARCGSVSYIKVRYNQTLIQNISIPLVNLSSSTDYYLRDGSRLDNFQASSSNLVFNLEYDQASSSNAWLNYIDLNVVRKLTLNSPLFFTNIYQQSAANRYRIEGAESGVQVWNVSDLKNVQKLPATTSGTDLYFDDDCANKKTYFVFNPSQIQNVASIRKVANQNLHALQNIEYVIVSPEIFRSQAQQIANYHIQNSGLSTVVVTNESIYNEFSSGTPDITAIKNLMRHLYHERSVTDTLKYLLLFGDGSYDNKTASNSNTNLILTYQSSGSIKVSGTYTSDDYFGLLDPNEGVTTGYLDIGIGRIVVKNTTEADAAVQKILNYSAPSQSFGNWRSKINMVADNGDGNLHINDADDIAEFIELNYPHFNLSKIYMDAYPLVESSGSDIAPEATLAFNNAINEGTLILNYTGHGGELGLAHEQLITNQDILAWKNKAQLATFITATCEFSRFDDKNRTSAGEYVFLNPNGGGIALFTTTRIAYAGPNKVINMAFYQQLDQDNVYRFGDLIRRTKNIIGSSSQNMRIFTLIGDPALGLAVPKKSISTLKINQSNINNIDTISISPLSKITVEGQIEDENGQLIDTFNGIVYPTVYDKPDTTLTLCQFECSAPVPFKNRKNIIYNGKATVANGKFQYTFVVPKDVSYKNGLGRISYYADNQTLDGMGHFEKLSVGGAIDTSIHDQKGPEIELYMNDENFIHGGITDENPMLIAKLFDDNGINTVGNGIGHDLTAKLDNDNKQSAVLNTYYATELDSYQSGTVRFPYANLSEGTHSIEFKAWDVLNNSSVQNVEFIVAESVEMAIKNIFNYPNPFTSSTNFYFDHNQTGQSLDVLIQIFTVSGKLVKTIESSFLSNGFHSEGIHWDGRDDFGDRIGRGVYIYRISVRNDQGQNVSEIQKLVLLK